MINRYLLIVSILLSSFSVAQIIENDSIQKRSNFDISCECISKIDRSEAREKQFESVGDCIRGAITQKQMSEGLAKIMEKVSDTLESYEKSGKEIDTLIVSDDSISEKLIIDASKGYDELERQLINDCGAMNSLLNDTAGISSENSVSKDKKALKAYDKGLEYYKKGNFEKALEYYKKAVKEDKKFAFAWDMVGISHRQLGNYKEAVKAYKKSLKIDPRGKMPLQNLPIAYRMLDEWEKAADYYRELIRFYPDDPEGYYGLGQCGKILKDYDMALDNMIQAYIKYQDTGSPYVKDAGIELNNIYSLLTESGKEALFMQYAEKHGLTVNKD